MDCGIIFNNDYKLKHERQVHSGKKLKRNIMESQAFYLKPQSNQN